MKKKRLLNLLVVAISVVWISGCKKLERVDPPCPVMSSIIQVSGRLGETVSITGSDFLAGFPGLYNVTIADKEVPVLDVLNSTTLRFKVPAGIGSGILKITTKGASSCANQGTNFIYKYTVTAGDVTNPFSGRKNSRACDECFNFPQGLAVDANSNILVADRDNHVIKKIDTLRPGTPEIFAGKKSVTGDHLDNPRLLAKFNFPTDVAVTESGIIYIADRDNNCIRKITGGDVATLCGLPGTAGYAYRDGSLADARFEQPVGIATDGKNLIMVTEPFAKPATIGRIRLVDAGPNPNVSTLPLNNATSKPFIDPFGIAYSNKRAETRNDDFKIFVADIGINKLNGLSSGGNLTAITNASLSSPYDVTFDGEGNLFVLDRGSKKVLVIYTDNSSDVIAGDGINGITFNSPSGITIDKAKKYLYISEEIYSTIIQIKLR